MRTSTVKLALLALASLVLEAPAQAQSWVDREIINAPGRLCLDLEGSFNNASPPGPGTLLVVSTCDGRDAQRWGVVGSESHDYENRPRQLMALSGRGIVARAGHAELGNEASTAHFVRDHIEITFQPSGTSAPQTLCLATANDHPSPGERALARPCDGSPRQRFTLAPR